MTLFVTERQFSQAVVDYARLTNWLVFRTWNSRHSPAGAPDLRMVRPFRVIFAEVKRELGKLTPQQEEAINLLRLCPGVEVYVWRRSDWEEIVRILARADMGTMRATR